MNSNLEKVKTLEVNLLGRRIGVINHLAGDNHIFSFDQEYIDDSERSTLSLSFKGPTGIIASPRPYHTKLPPFFSNLLPEGHLRTYLAKKATVNPEREFFLLAALGEDLPGALTITPTQQSTDISKESTEKNAEEKRHETLLRFSLAGVQLKFSAVLEASGGLTIPTTGIGGSWIVKLPSARYPAVPENEYVMLTLAKAVGIILPENRLVNIEDICGLPEDVTNMAGQALAIARFDRGANHSKIHMEDFAQVFGVFPADKYHSRSYANIAAVLWAETGETGTYEFLRRLIFSVVIGNADMHLKNWSLLYHDPRTPVLSPAYDLVSTLPYIANDQLALNFGESRSLNEITPQQIRRFSDTARLPMSPIPEIVVETVEKTVNAWRTLAEKDILPTVIKNAIDRQIINVAQNTLRLF